MADHGLFGALSRREGTGGGGGGVQEIAQQEPYGLKGWRVGGQETESTCHEG
jgi:hypothetical protein